MLRRNLRPESCNRPRRHTETGSGQYRSRARRPICLVKGEPPASRERRQRMNRDVTELIGSIRSLENRLDIQLEDQFEPWRNMWTGMVGAVYQFRRAECYLSGSPRSFKKIIQESRGLLSALDAGLPPELDSSWLSGFFLNNTEFRIAMVLHKVLQMRYKDCEVISRCSVPAIALGLVESRRCRSIHRRWNAPCDHPPHFEIREQPTLQILNELTGRSKSGKTASHPSNLWKCSLKVVHGSVNESKHTAMPRCDQMSPSERFRVDLTALCELIAMFEVFAICATVLRTEA